MAELDDSFTLQVVMRFEGRRQLSLGSHLGARRHQQRQDTGRAPSAALAQLNIGTLLLQDDGLLPFIVAQVRDGSGLADCSFGGHHVFVNS